MSRALLFLALVGCAEEQPVHLALLRPSSGILEIAELRMWSIRAHACGDEDERELRVPIGGGRINLLSRSEHYLGTEPACQVELRMDDTDPTPFHVAGTTGDGVDFDLYAPVASLTVPGPVSFLRCEHAMLIDPDPLMAVISAEGASAGSTVGDALSASLWMGSRAQAERVYGSRWLSLAPPLTELEAEHCAALAEDTGAAGELGQPGGGHGCQVGGSSAPSSNSSTPALLWAAAAALLLGAGRRSSGPQAGCEPPSPVA